MRLARLYLVNDLLANAGAPVPGASLIGSGIVRALPAAFEAARVAILRE